MRTLVRCVIIGTIIVALLTATVIILLLNPVAGSTVGAVLTSGEPTDIRYVTFNNRNGQYSFFFDDTEGGYVIDDIPPELADLNVFIDFMSNCANLTALRAMPKSDVDLSETGLADPQAQVEIIFFDGSSIDLAIGDTERVSGNYYALLSGSDNVYILPQATAQRFLLPKTQIISRYVTPPLTMSSPLSAIRDITFDGGSLTQPVTIKAVAVGDDETRLSAISFGAATHVVSGEADYRLDQTYGIEIFGSLLGLEGEIVGYNLSEDEIAAFGFDNPYMTVSYDMLSSTPDAIITPVVLKVVEAEDGKFYATRELTGAVYKIDREPFIDIEFGRLPVRWFLSPLLADLKAIEVKSNDNSGNNHYRFEIDNTDPRNVNITHNGETLDSELFQAFYRLITSAAHDGDYLGPLPTPSDEPVLELTYEYTTPEKQPDTLSLHLGEARRVNVYINGAGEFAMRDTFIQRVLEACENLIKDQPVEENW